MPVREASGDGEGVSRNASEPSSASLRESRAASLPKVLKPITGGQATGVSGRRALRGGRGRRVPKETTRNLRDPACGFVTHGRGRERITAAARDRESEGSVVATKRGNARGAKGPRRRRA